MVKIERRPFGRLPDGELAEVLTLTKGPCTCRILTYGATLQSLIVPDRQGTPIDVVLGYDSLEEYRTQDAYLGAVVGRFANRIAKGVFTLDGEEYTLAVNNGPNHLHGGLVGFSYRIWTVAEQTEDRVVLTLDSPEGEEGYPGHLTVKVTYALEENGLSIRYEAESDRATPINLTNHSYFNLSGHDSGSVLDQTVQIFAQGYTPSDETSVPYGRVDPVEGTPMDLHRPTRLGEHIDEPFQQLVWGRGYDHNYVIDGPVGRLRPAASAWSDQTGIHMDTFTTCPGMQLYTANWLSDRRGKGGIRYGERQAFCLETQFYPDSPNQPSFPSCILRPGEKFDHTTKFIFHTEE